MGARAALRGWELDRGRLDVREMFVELHAKPRVEKIGPLVQKGAGSGGAGDE